MLTNRIAIVCSVFAVLAISSSPPAVAASDRLLPDTTKAAFIVPDMDALNKSCDETQMAAMLRDPRMKPFARSLREQINGELSKNRQQLGITWEDVKGISTGEVAVGMIQPGKDQHATAFVADVTGNLDRANDLLAKVADDLQKQDAKRQPNLKEGNIDIVHYSVPRKKENEMMKDVQVYHAIANNHLVAADHEGVIRNMLKRVTGAAAGPGVLADVESYSTPMSRCRQAAGDLAPHIRWYIEPKGYVSVMRAAGEDRKPRGKDTIRILEEQGFDAVLGMGGYLTFMTGKHELLHRTFIYAPPVEGADSGDKYKDAAAMLNFPNAEEPADLEPQPWIPQRLSTYIRFNWRIERAFKAAGSLVDALVGEDAFKRMLHGLEVDPAGPRIDLSGDIIANLSHRVSLMTDYVEPVVPESERWLFALEIKPDKVDIVKRTIDKWMEHEPDVVGRDFEGHKIWEVQEPPDEVGDLEIDINPGFRPGGGLDFGGVEEEELEEEKPLLPNAAITVAKGHILIASRIDLMQEILSKERPALADAADYRRMTAALVDLEAGRDSFRMFRRSDQAFRPSYELLRQGKMPESRSLLGRLLNGALRPEEQGAGREQLIDGKELPVFKVVQRYLGEAGSYVRTEDDGWSVTGCLLKKD